MLPSTRGSSCTLCTPHALCSLYSLCNPRTPYTLCSPRTPYGPCTLLSRAQGLQGHSLAVQPPPQFVAVKFPAKQRCSLTALANWSKLIYPGCSFLAHGLFPCMRDEFAASESLWLLNRCRAQAVMEPVG